MLDSFDKLIFRVTSLVHGGQPSVLCQFAQEVIGFVSRNMKELDNIGAGNVVAVLGQPEDQLGISGLVNISLPHKADALFLIRVDMMRQHIAAAPPTPERLNNSCRDGLLQNRPYDCFRQLDSLGNMTDIRARELFQDIRNKERINWKGTPQSVLLVSYQLIT